MTRPFALVLLLLVPTSGRSQTLGRGGPTGSIGDSAASAASVDSGLGSATVSPVPSSLQTVSLTASVVPSPTTVLLPSANSNIAPTALGPVVVPSASKSELKPETLAVRPAASKGAAAAALATQLVLEDHAGDDAADKTDAMREESSGFFDQARRYIKSFSPFGGNAVEPRPATFSNVQADPASYQSLTGRTLDLVDEYAAAGRLRLVDIKPGIEKTLKELPVKIVPGRYYVAVKTKDGLVVTDYPLQHGGHRKLTIELGLPAPRKLDTDGTPVGGVIFYDDGVVVSGQALRYPSSRNASDLARELKRMGFRIREKRAGPIRGPNSSPTGAFDARNIPLGL